MSSKKPPVAPSAALVLPKSPLGLSAEALFRHGVVSQVLGRVLGGELRDAVVRDIASRSYRGAESAGRGASPRTVYRWLLAFATGGVAALQPVARTKTATSEVLSDRLVEFLRTEKGEDSRASVPELVRRAREEGVLAEDEHVDRVSVWRACPAAWGCPWGSARPRRTATVAASPTRTG